LHHREEFRGADGLGDISVHSRGQTTFAVFFQGMCSTGDDGRSPAGGFFSLADFRGGFEPVHFRHLDVHQHERLPAILGYGDAEPAFLQQGLRQGAIDGAVFRFPLATNPL